MKSSSPSRFASAAAALLVALRVSHAATHVTGVNPLPSASQQLPSTPVVVQFDTAIDPGTVTPGSLQVWGEFSGRHSGTYSPGSVNTEITFAPGTAFFSGETVRVNVSSQIRDALGAPISPWQSQFTVRSAASAAEFARGVTVANVGGKPAAMTAADVNGDGKLDLIVGGTAGGTISVLFGNGDGTFAAPVAYPTDPNGPAGGGSVCVADVNGDGFGDILVGNYGTSPWANMGMAVLLNDGTGHFGSPTTYPALGDNPAGIAAGDLDGDGYVDVVVSVFPGFQILFNDGTGHFSNSILIEGHVRGEGISLGDVNGDGRLDVLNGDDRGGYCSVTINLGNRAFASPVKYDAGWGSRGTVLTDLNGDRTLDIVTGSFQANASITTYANDGAGHFDHRADYLVNSILGPWGVCAADFDGDGRPDVATADMNGGTPFNFRSVSFWMNSGGGAFYLRKDVDAGGQYPSGIAWGDFDGDGDLDLVIGHYLSGTIALLRNTAANVTGFVYLDDDANCAQSGSTEVGVGGRQIRVIDSSGGIRFERTRNDGTFTSVLPTGNYTVNMVHNATSAETCNGGAGKTFNITVTDGTPVTGLNFAAAHCCQATVNCASLIGWPCPPGSPCTHGSDGHFRNLCPCEVFRYEVTVCNPCTSPLLPGTVVQLQLDQNVKFLSFPAFISTCNNVVGSLASQGVPEPQPPCSPASGGQNTGQLVQWTLNNALPGGDCCTFFVEVQVANVALGTSLHSTPSVSAQCNPGPTQIFVPGQPCVDEVRCSYDPNDKSVSPKGCGPMGNVAPGTALTYRVRFQNLGNAPAARVIVRDVLDPALDPESLEILSTSHPLTSFKIYPGQEMIWTFDSINLPAAVSDEAGSHGEFVYRVKPFWWASDGRTILNTAAIYFDQNPPVITATTTNTIRTRPETEAAFTAQFSTTQPGLVYDFTYTGTTPDGATYAWNFGADATPATSTERNPAGILFAAPGSKTVTLTVERYGCTASASQTIDASIIALNCPGNLTAEATDPAGAPVVFNVSTSARRCGGAVTVVCTPPSGSVFPIGHTTVNCVANDSCGASVTCSFNVDVTARMQLNCPSDLSMTTLIPFDQVVSFDVSASSACGGPVTVESVPPSGSLFPLGRTTVNVTATDSCGNTITRSFVVDLSLPDAAPVRLRIARAPGGYLLSWPNSASDFILQSTPQLDPPAWTDVPPPVVVVGIENTVLVPVSDLQMSFFRLASRPEAAASRSLNAAEVCSPTTPAFITIGQGLNLLSLPEGDLNQAALPAAQSDTALFLWAPSSQWLGTPPIFNNGAWDPTLPTLKSREGFAYFRVGSPVAYNPIPASLNPGWWGASTTLRNGLYLLGYGGLTGGTFERIVGELPHYFRYVAVRRLDPTTHTYRPAYTFANGRWSPEAPLLAGGEAAFVQFGPDDGPSSSDQLSGVTPSQVIANPTPVNIILTGRIPSGVTPTIQLMKSYAPNAATTLSPQSVQVSADRAVLCAQFDFSPAALASTGYGDYDVVMTWTSGVNTHSRELRSALRVLDPGSIYHSVSGSTVLKPNRTENYVVTLQNNSGAAATINLTLSAASVQDSSTTTITEHPLPDFLTIAGQVSLANASGTTSYTPVPNNNNTGWTVANLLLPPGTSTLTLPLTPTALVASYMPLVKYSLLVKLGGGPLTDPVVMPSFIHP